METLGPLVRVKKVLALQPYIVRVEFEDRTVKEIDLDNYLFGDATRNLTAEQRKQVEERVRHEML